MTSRAILALLLVLHTAASAISIRDLRRLQASDELVGENYVHYYLIGAMEGSREAHAHAVRAGARPQICVGDRRLEPRMALGFGAESWLATGPFHGARRQSRIRASACRRNFERWGVIRS